MYIHYDEITKRVTGWTGFIMTEPEEVQDEDAVEIAYKKPVFTEPTLELKDDFIFEFDAREYEVRDGEVVYVGKSDEMIAEQAQVKKNSLMSKMQSIFTKKVYEIKAITLDRQGSNEYLDAQAETYKTMYELALGKTDDVSKAIIVKHEAQIALTSELVLAVQGLRSSIEKSIKDGFDATALLDEIDSYKLALEDCDTSVFKPKIARLLA